jgi:hypothetical protein
MKLTRIALLGLLAVAGCGRHDAAKPGGPAILDFAAGQLAVDAGQPAQLHWQVRDAVRLWIEPGVGRVGPAGSVEVSPRVTTAYTLHARDAAGIETSAALTVNVNQAAAKPSRYPILFVTQAPVEVDNATRLSAFANHLPGVEQAPRGGDLMLRYPDGSLRNLTREAGFGSDGEQGERAIAVREPSVDWDGKRAVFSMVVGAPAFWQVYEVSRLEQGERAVIRRIPGQPQRANNVSPLRPPALGQCAPVPPARRIRSHPHHHGHLEP